MELELTVKTPSGLEVVLKIGEYLGRACLGSGSVPAKGLRGFASGPFPLPCVRDGASHSVRIGYAEVGLPTAEAQRIQSALETLQAEIDAQPKRQAQILEAQRQRLEGAVVAARHQADFDRETAWEAGDERRGVARDGRADFAEATARKALADFDALHPEVLARLEAAIARRAEELLLR